MSLTYPLDILSDFPGWATLSLSHGDETSGQAGGQVRVKNIRGPLWTMRAETKRLMPSVFRAWKARLESLENGKKTFLGYDMSACYPIRYPNGTWPTGNAFDGVSASVMSLPSSIALSLDGLPAAYQASVGDYLQFWTVDSPEQMAGLHQVVEPATANGSGETPVFEVRPPLRQGVEVGSRVAVKRPAAIMMLVPGSLSTPAALDGRGTISFEAIEVV